tara:strand:+ start:1981 stop:2508 length:528 start_codon:yes stop_codon:yes gene_type:complete
MEDNFDLNKLTKDKKPKKVNSRNKGQSFERKIATMLNNRFNTKEFCRSPGSGAFATTHNIPDHLKLHGDLLTPLDFKFCIECKKGYNKENILSLLNKRSDVWKFIDQCEKDSKKCNKEPLVIFQQDRQKILAITRSNTLNNNIKKIDIQRTGNKEYNNYSIYLFEDLLQDEDTWI